MWNWKKTGWTLWAVVDALLLAYLTVWPGALYPLLAILVAQSLLYAWRDASPITFPVQLRVFYLLIVIVGLVPGLGFLNWLQFLGTAASLTFDYCPLARMTVLLPWNRVVPLSWEVVRVAIFSSPRNECIVHVISGVGAPVTPAHTPAHTPAEEAA